MRERGTDRLSEVEIVKLIAQLKSSYVAQSFALLLLIHPELPEWMESRGFDVGSRIKLGRVDNSQFDNLPELHEALAAARNNAQFNLEFLATLLTVHVSWIGAELAHNNYFDKAPVLEFFRHLRNALSHGNRWNFAKGEPRRPARFAQFELDPALSGECVLFTFMSTGDVLALFDEVSEHLQSLP